MKRDPNRRKMLPIVTMGVIGLCLILPSRLPAQQLKPLATLNGHTGTVISLAFSPDGNTLASGGADNAIKVWEVATGQNTITVDGAGANEWCWVAFSPDGKMLVSAGADQKIRLWTIANGKSAGILDAKQKAGFPMVIFSPDNKTIAWGGTCLNTVKLWELSTRKNTATLEGYDAWGILAMLFTSDNKTLVTMGREDGIKLWDVASGKNTSMLKTDSDVRCATFTLDGKSLATVSFPAIVKASGQNVVKDAGRIKLWEVTTGKELTSITGYESAMISVSFSPDGKRLACGSQDGTIKIWDVATGKEFVTLDGHPKGVGALAFSPGGKIMASGSQDGTIILWDLGKMK
jgi:WD40 repeat protein